VHQLLGNKCIGDDKLQRAQNNLARVVCQSRGRTDARPLLHCLHWLPVRQRVTYKLPVLRHKVRTTATPIYLSELHHLGLCALPMLSNRLLSYGQKTTAKQRISAILNFKKCSYLVIWLSSCSKRAVVYQISSKSDDFFCWVMADVGHPEFSILRNWKFTSRHLYCHAILLPCAKFH